MSALLRSGKFLRMVSGVTRQQIGQPNGPTADPFALKTGGANGESSNSSLSIPSASFDSQSGSSASFQTWSLHNLQGALPAISVVPADIPDRERENEKKDPLLEFFEPIEQDKTSKPQSRASSECPKDTCHKVVTPAAPALKDIKKPSITVTDTSETSQGLNLFKTDPELQLTQSESVSEPPSSDTTGTLNQTSDLIDTEVSSSQLKHDVDSSTQAEALGDLEKQDKVIDVVSSIQPAQQPPAIYDIVPGVSSVVPVVPLADPSGSGVTQWYPLPVVCQMFRQQGRYWDLEMLLEGSRGIRAEDRKMVYFWTLQAYADVGLFDRAVALSGQLHLEGLGHHFPEYHQLMSSFAAAHTSFAPTMPYSAYAFATDATVPTPIATATPTDVSLVNSPSSSCPPTPAPCDVTAAQSKGQEKGRRRPSNTSSATSGVASESKARRINMKSHLMTRKFKKALADEDATEAVKLFDELKSLNGLKSLGVTELSAYIELLVKEERVSEATRLTEEMLSLDLQPMPKIFRFLLNKLASSGEVEAMTRLGDTLTSRAKKEVSFDNRLCNAYLASGRGGEYLDILTRDLDEVMASPELCHDEERVQSLKDKFPRGGAMGLLESNPDLVDSYTSMAHKFLVLGYVAPMNVLWTYHFIGGRHELAQPLWENYVKACPQIMFQKVCQTARATSNPDLAQRLVALLEKAETVTVGARGIAYSCLLDVLTSRGEYTRGVQALREGLESGSVKIDDVNRTALKRLKEGLEATTVEKFPYPLPKKTNVVKPSKADVIDHIIASEAAATGDHDETASVLSSGDDASSAVMKLSN